MTVRELVRGAIIAAVYALLTIVLAPISSGLIQCRVSEAMSVLPYFTFSAVPGLFIGCLIANLLTGAPIYDVVFGSLATLLAAYMTYLLRKRAPKWFAPLPFGGGERSGGRRAADLCLSGWRWLLGCGGLCRARSGNRMFCAGFAADVAAEHLS